MPMINMKSGDGPMGELVPDGGPEYPVGLRITLGEEEIKKLLMKEFPQVGEELQLNAEAKVIEVGEDTEKGDQERRRLVLQITSLGLYADKKSDSDKFYGG